MSEESRVLADIIKHTHRQLRKTYRLTNDDKSVWMGHCQNTEDLEKYAQSMHKLATNHWEKLTLANPHTSRIHWSHQTILEYFYGNGLTKARRKFMSQCEGSFLENDKSKIKILDVGSCYNPFGQFKELDVTAVDLCPATEKVTQCDFLNVDIQSDMLVENGKVFRLAREHFHCVIFSFLLEYFPSSAQRWVCCCKAQQLLCLEGLLIIVTPDSKAAHSNANMIRSWKEALETIGFKRVKYEKLQHAHCMAFRKTEKLTCSEMDNQSLASKMYIPQDFQNLNESDDEDCYVRCTDEDLQEGFAELPQNCFD